MQLMFCGTSGGAPTDSRACAGLLVTAGDSTVLLDCGIGSLRQLSVARVSLQKIDAVLLSHLHLDHAGALPELLARRAQRRTAPPEIHGPAGTADYAARALQLVEVQMKPYAVAPQVWSDPVVHQTQPGALRVFDFDVTSEAVRHPPVHAFARRIEADGRSIVYSGDTVPEHEVMVKLAEGADVLIHEVYSDEALERSARDQEDYRGRHSEVREVARIASAAGVDRLILTHLLPTEEPTRLRELASSQFSGEVLVASDGMTLEV